MKEKRVAQISQLTKALTRLKETLTLPPTQINKDATIQRFEFTFELCWKLMQGLARAKGLEIFTPRDSIRVAGQIALIENVETWFDFLEARNLSSHVYDEEMANEVYQEIKKFLPEAEKFLEKVKTGSGAD